MECNGITNEGYALWPLGLTEESEAEQIRAHLETGCPTCTHAVRESLRFWAAYGAAASADMDATPRAGARAKLLAAVESEGKSFVTPRTPPKNPPVAKNPAVAKVIPFRRRSFILQVVGIAAAFMFATAIGWQYMQKREAPAQAQPQASSAQLNELNRQIAGLQAKLNVSEKELENLRETAQAPAASPEPVASQPSPVKTVTYRGDSGADFSEMEKSLAEANLQLQQLKSTLAGEQAKSARLSQEFDQQVSLLTSTQKGRREAEANLAAAMARLAERDRQLKALDAKIIMLEHERDRLSDAITNQRGRVEHAVRLVSLLSAPTTKFMRLTGTEAAPNASGYAILAEGNRLIFSGTNLPALQGGKVYQLWLMRGKNPGIVSGGVFQGGSNQATVEFSDPNMLKDVKALAVTDEPKGGSPLPTGHKMLIGAARS